MRFTEVLLGFMANVAAGVVLSFFLPALATHPQRWWIVLALIGCGTAATATIWLGRWLTMLRRMGIVALLPSTIEGRGSTRSILRAVRDQFAFMGIGASKWVKATPEFEDAMRRVTAFAGQRIRFLLLDPCSGEAIRLSQLEYGNPTALPRLIKESLRTFRQLRDAGHSIDVKLYRSTPIFRLAIVNNDTVYLGSYRRQNPGEDSPQAVLSRNSRASLFQPSCSHFEHMWLCPQCIDVNWDLVEP